MNLPNGDAGRSDNARRSYPAGDAITVILAVMMGGRAS